MDLEIYTVATDNAVVEVGPQKGLPQEVANTEQMWTTSQTAMLRRTELGRAVPCFLTAEQACNIRVDSQVLAKQRLKRQRNILC